MKVVRIGNSSGFWGDDPTALFRMANAGELDYITCDYLAEVSMSILSKQQQKQPDLGYVADFLKHFKEFYGSKEKRTCDNCGTVMPVDERFVATE